ncbi:hypothetical protein TVAG_242040 [Trichomonas vaginalis G3]|uniref:Uncharacterized protein n=1 Tax=Trichomonas vaginalis (strain ATCC PRA-98 / G3) TaxID=412133 RepID=A2GIT5_TRIV3|nr:hypothetical protein TVAGG3_0098130 [Trichomonas vaginalis G3]EAX82932.1 hypothetical protein TVAG_242040 [Trichomonas vaginalis G3]KAI5544238.1 hypothetical protein TVAGG3_0098130 [Trichomonas vaginalis G3]|eukprot:XP_001295862.1 hypothetical protein [Trichomonas vaginalis G3]
MLASLGKPREEQRDRLLSGSPKLYEDVKQIVQDTLPQTHYDMKGCTILTFKEDLPLLKEKITEYVDKFKQAE